MPVSARTSEVLSWGESMGVACSSNVKDVFLICIFDLNAKKMSRSYKSNSNNSIYFSVFHFKNKSLTQ